MKELINKLYKEIHSTKVSVVILTIQNKWDAEKKLL